MPHRKDYDIPAKIMTYIVLSFCHELIAICIIVMKDKQCCMATTAAIQYVKVIFWT